MVGSWRAEKNTAGLEAQRCKHVIRDNVTIAALEFPRSGLSQDSEILKLPVVHHTVDVLRSDPKKQKTISQGRRLGDRKKVNFRGRR